MASIRKLKKDINYLAYELLTEAFAFKHFHPELEEKKFDDVIKKIVKLRSELISRLNNFNKEEGKQTEFFRKLNEDMIKMVDYMTPLNK